MKVSALVVTTASLLTAATSWAAPLVLHAQDSITLDGSRYSCDDPSRKGVHLVPGDHMNAGGYQLHCVGGDDDARARPPTPDVTIQSKVDTGCLHDLYQKASGSVSAADSLDLAASCRPFQIEKSCRITTTAPDADCIASMQQIVTGSYSDAELPKAMNACRRITAVCPALPTQVTSKVDVECISHLWTTSPGRQDVATLVSWMDSCRDHAPEACVVEGGTLEPDCVSKVSSFISGNLSPKDAATLERACRTLDLRCQ